MCEPVACGHGDRLDLLEHVPGLLRPDDPFRANTCKGTVGQHDRRLGVFDDLVDTAELAMRVEEAVAGRYRKLAIFATLVPRKGKPFPRFIMEKPNHPLWYQCPPPSFNRMIKRKDNVAGTEGFDRCMLTPHYQDLCAC